MTSSPPATRDRIVAAATDAFAADGVAGTSLDALAGVLGVTKQTILYHFGSKDGLTSAVVESGAHELVAVLDEAVATSVPGWDRVEATVRAAFRLAIRRPELLGLLREVSRLGPPTADVVLDILQPVVDQTIDHLEAALAGSDRRSGPGGVDDPRLVLVSAYTMVTGVVTDSEVLRAVGLELDLRVAAGLRRTLLSFLESALSYDHNSRPEPPAPIAS